MLSFFLPAVMPVLDPALMLGVFVVGAIGSWFAAGLLTLSPRARRVIVALLVALLVSVGLAQAAGVSTDGVIGSPCEVCTDWFCWLIWYCWV
jgi:hypothetical protein